MQETITIHQDRDCFLLNSFEYAWSALSKVAIELFLIHAMFLVYITISGTVLPPHYTIYIHINRWFYYIHHACMDPIFYSNVLVAII
jgi:hypothetical protein